MLRLLPRPAGKYIFLTLFLAVTLEAFEAKYDSPASLNKSAYNLSGVGGTSGIVSFGDKVGGGWPGGRGTPPSHASVVGMGMSDGS